MKVPVTMLREAAACLRPSEDAERTRAGALSSTEVVLKFADG